MQVVGEKYFLGAGDPVKAVADPFEFVDVRKYDSVVERDFNLAVMNCIPGDQLAVFLYFIDEVVLIIPGLLEGAFAGFDFMADLKPKILGVCLPDLIEHPVLDLENNQSDVAAEKYKVRLFTLDIRRVPGDVLIVGPRNRFQKPVKLPFPVGLELLHIFRNHDRHI